MIITRLSLKNFGVYAGLNTFEFNGSKPIVLIGGMNGRGKTTFLEAVLLALYGANSFAYHESKYKTYGQYLKAYVNTADNSLEAYVELEFKLDPTTNERYLINRSWSGAGQRTREKIVVKKDGEYSVFLTDNWSLFVENILPSGLSNFFFFDGEKIAELAVENTSTQMKESIKALLGVSVLDVLENDLSRIISKVAKNSENHMATKELDLLRDKKNQADVALQLSDERLREIGSQIEENQKKIEKARLDYSSKGGDVVTQRQDLFTQRSTLKAQVDQGKEQLIAVSAGELPLLLVKDLISDIYWQAQKEHEAKITGYAIEKMNAMAKDYALANSAAIGSVKDFIDFVQKKSQEEGIEFIYDISDQALYLIGSLLNNKLIKEKGEALRSMAVIQKNQAKINEIDSYLSVDIDENALSKIYKQIKSLEAESIDLQVALEAEEKKRTALHGEAIRASSEYSKFVEELLSNLELNDDSDRIIKYAHQANSILEAYKIRLQERKVGVLAKTMTTCYKKLANKKNLINTIEMDAKTLDFIYRNSDGYIVPKESLSAGEKQLMVISLLWALAICSKKKLPVIIDTPLSRMDSNHRISLITTYFPNASDQTIILSTDSEIDHNYYELMKDNVGDEYTLEYDDDNKRSTITRGYFLGEKYDNKTNQTV